MADFSDLIDFETSPEFEELWRQIEKQDPSSLKSPLVPENGATQCEASKAVFKDTTEPSLLKNLLSSTVKKEPMTTPFNQRNTAENVQTKQPLVATVLEGNDPLKAELPFKSYSACTASVSTPSYSPALDENWPPTLTDSTSLTANTEDSILTTFRRNNQRKFKALEKRFTEPRVVASREFEVLQFLQKRMALDLQQSEIILNYLTAKYGEPAKKRAKSSSQ